MESGISIEVSSLTPSRYLIVVREGSRIHRFTGPYDMGLEFILTLLKGYVNDD